VVLFSWILGSNLLGRWPPKLVWFCNLGGIYYSKYCVPHIKSGMLSWFEIFLWGNNSFFFSVRYSKLFQILLSFLWIFRFNWGVMKYICHMVESWNNSNGFRALPTLIVLMEELGQVLVSFLVKFWFFTKKAALVKTSYDKSNKILPTTMWIQYGELMEAYKVTLWLWKQKLNSIWIKQPTNSLDHDYQWIWQQMSKAWC